VPFGESSFICAVLELKKETEISFSKSSFPVDLVLIATC